MKKYTLFLLLLGVTSTKPISLSLTDIAYWVGTIATLHWVSQRIERIESLQEAQITAYNTGLEENKKSQRITIPDRPRLTDSLQTLYNSSRQVAHTTVRTANGLQALSSTSLTIANSSEE